MVVTTRGSKCKSIDEGIKSSSSSPKKMTKAQFYRNRRYQRMLSGRQIALYDKHVRESEGFDVPHFPNVTQIGIITPSNKNFENDEQLKMFVRMAIEHFKTNVDQDAKPEHAKVATLQFCGTTIKHYITFAAIDVADHDQLKTYQAVVLTGCFNRLEVKFSRLKPIAAPTPTPSSKLFQRDAQAITLEALESVKAAHVSSEIDHKAETKKKAVPRKGCQR